MTLGPEACVSGVVSYQPGLAVIDAARGQAGVCFAEIRQGHREVQCALWHAHAAALAAFPVVSVVALMQVRVKRCPWSSSLELRDGEATQVKACPAALANTIRAETNLAESADSAEAPEQRHGLGLGGELD